MIAVDTNVLLRRVLNDDAEQSAKARRLFEGSAAVLITDVVLAEAVWTLAGRRYGATKGDIRELVMSLMEEPNIMFEDRQAVWSALNDFDTAKPVKTADGMKSADFADALVVNKAKRLYRDEYEGTYTFDRAAQEIPGTKTP